MQPNRYVLWADKLFFMARLGELWQSISDGTTLRKISLLMVKTHIEPNHLSEQLYRVKMRVISIMVLMVQCDLVGLLSCFYGKHKMHKICCHSHISWLYYYKVIAIMPWSSSALPTLCVWTGCEEVAEFPTLTVTKAIQLAGFNQRKLKVQKEWRCSCIIIL